MRAFSLDDAFDSVLEPRRPAATGGGRGMPMPPAFDPRPVDDHRPMAPAPTHPGAPHGRANTIVLDASKTSMPIQAHILTAVPVPLPSDVPMRGKEAPGKLVTPPPASAGTNFAYTTGRCGMLDAVMTAYNYHRRLVLPPDAIWTTIVTSLATYLHTNAERLRSLLVSHEGKKELIVAVPPAYETSDAAIEWPQVLATIVGLIAGDATAAGAATVAALQPQFSTTDVVSRTAAAIVTMAGFRAFYDYGMMTFCGVPAVTFEGTLADWQALRDRVAAFATLAVADDNLRAWVGRLTGTLDNLVATAHAAFGGYVLTPALVSWWAHMYSNRVTYGSGGSTYISGWVLDFFMYDGGGKLLMPGEEVPLGDLPASWSQVPFFFQHLSGYRRRMTLYAGSWDAEVDADSVRPLVRFAVSDASAADAAAAEAAPKPTGVKIGMW